MPPTLYLIDGHALAYRTYFALTAAGADRWKTPSGEPTAGTYGFASVLLRIFEQEKPEYLAVAFDTGKTFRDELYPEYKATREKMPDDLRIQIKRIREMVDTFKIPRLEVEGFEADDVLGTVANQAVEKGFGVKIITGDRDLLQLVTERIYVNLPGKQLSDASDYGIQDVKTYMGVYPNQIVDYKALVGDTSDNIPGVKGIGEKTAVSLYESYPDLDTIYQNLDKLPAKVKNKLESDREAAYLSRDLARIRLDVPIRLELDKARTNQYKADDVIKLFRELEFKTLISKFQMLAGIQGIPVPDTQMNLFGQAVTNISLPAQYQPKFTVVDTGAALAQLVKVLEKSPVIAFDTETTSTDPLLADLVGISLSVKPGEGYYIPLGHKTASRQLEIPLVIEALRSILTDPSKELVGHNLKFDGHLLANYGLVLPKYAFDTMIAEWLVDPSSRSLGLKEMADRYMNIEMTHIEELIGRGKTQINMADVPVEKVAPYAAADAEVTLQLRPILTSKLKEQHEVKLLNEIEMPLIPVLAEMERAGIAVDKSFFKKMSAELTSRLKDLESLVIDTVGYDFNLNSTQQLSKALFETLRLSPPDKRFKNASGFYSTSAEVLEQIRHEHDIISWLLEYRELSKLRSTYVDSLPEQINPKTRRIHTSFNQIGSVTGRLASANPNLQNIPTRTEVGRLVRQAFVASPGCCLLAVDYSQIELRIVAHMSGDESMLAAFRAGQDIHAATAAAVFGIPIESVTKDQRRQAKAINFGLIYGMSAFGLSNSTDLTLAEAEDFVKAYFQQFPGVKNYLDGIRLEAARQGYVETLLGRRRYFPNLQNPKNAMLKNREEREAINAPIQGTAADIIKISMIRMMPRLKVEGLAARMLLQVHDELIFELPEAELHKTSSVVQDVMENAYKLSIPLETDARYGTNWGELIPLEK